MAFIPLPNSIQVCWHFLWASQKVQFCLVVKNDAGDPDVTDLSAAANVAADFWANQLASDLSSGISCTETVATDMTQESGQQVKVAVGTAGIVANNSVPNNVAGVISLRTAKRGRSYRGRIYVPGIPHDQLATSTTLAGTITTNLLSHFGTLFTAFANGGFTPVVASRRHNGVTTNPAHLESITTLVMDSFVDSQRRRLFGRGD